VSLLQDFKRGCETYREQAINGRLATPEEIAKQWPGGEYNPGKTLKQWAGCYGWLKGLCVQIKMREEQRARDSANKRTQVLDAIAEIPETVFLMQMGEDGERKTLTVYQKSDVALRVIHGLNLQLASLVDDYKVITEHGSQDDTELIVRLLAEQSYLQRVIVWIATSRGPRLPFEEGDLRPEPPAHLSALHSLDFYTVAQAFQRVNAVFWSGMEEVTGKPAPELMRDRGLLSLVAAASERIRSQEDARNRAESERRKAS
jgi:hypothetical protein